ncbi:MAG TPA: large extracellular alpha-helical protein, partial [Desulfobulbaceae bacterium]|nr:large extracellular alpha-helical protein [Desulfobulbaceae bacterium]
GPGGGGGPDLSMRSLFKFVSYWNPSLIADAEGKATIEFAVPDNLTGWKVLAMAVSPEDRMGLGEAVFKVNQATEIRPALPNQLLAGDTFSAGFAIMNRTDQPRKLTIDCTAQGPVKGADGEETVRFDREFTLAPYQRETLFFPMAATAAGTISLTITAGDATDRDGLTVSVPVGERRHGEVVASYGMISDATAIQPLLFPENMGKDGGELSLLLSPSVIGGIDGAFSFLRDYPFSCWEQKLSRGMMAALHGPLKAYMPKDFSWPDSDRTARETLTLAAEYQAPNGGMTYYLPKDEYVSPYLSAYTALAFNRLRREGYLVPGQVEQRLQDYLQNLLRHDAVPAEFSRGMTATVRA